MKWDAPFPEELDRLSVAEIVKYYSQKHTAKVIAALSLRTHASLILSYSGYWGPYFRPAPEEDRPRRVALSEKLLAAAVQIEQSLSSDYLALAED